MTINIDPVIGKLGPLEFGWYGVIMAIAVAVALWVISRQLVKRGIASHHVLGIAIFGVPCGIIGARLVHVLDHLGYYLENPSKIFGGQLVGLAIYGVIGGGLLGILIYCKWKKLSALKVIDSIALAFPVGQIIGKCANIINGDTWGSPTDSAWNFTYTNPNSFIPDNLLGVPTHPTPMYEQLWLMVIVGLLIWLMPRLMKVNGLSILTYFWLYSVGRFVISFWRVNDPLLWGLKEAQVIALVVIVVAPIVAYWLVRRARKRPPEKPGPPNTGSQKHPATKSPAPKSAPKKGPSAKGGASKAKAGSAKARTGSAKSGAAKYGARKAKPA
jgi:phosphatidylglycerol:prolipoprotein diacylglycerol transferase